jgi:ribonuclease-3
LSRPSSSLSGLDALGVPAQPGSLYELALTHRSYAFENGHHEHNERLEFLGDAVLGVVVTDLVYHDYPQLAEGEMARLRASAVNTGALAELARELELGRHIRLGKGEEASGGKNKPSLLADTLEALIGALYLDRGLDAVAAVIVPRFRKLLAAVMEAGGGHDPKTALQELSVRSRSVRPTYRVTSSGPDHDKRFVAEVFVAHELVGAGSGRSKKQAEQGAAREALAHLSERTLESLASAPAASSEESSDARAS